MCPKLSRDVSTRATGATAVAPKFSDTLTLFQPRGTDSAYHRRGRTYIFPVVMSLSQRKKVDGTNKTIYRISANSFRGNYSFLNLVLCTVTFGDST